MSRGDINAFLSNLFKSEGGKNPRVVNQYGYIGKYQFGEDALIDLGYYKPDGTANRTPSGKFKYDWAGEWTGKNGVTCKDDFLENENTQDKAAKEWVKLLCSRAKKFKLQQYIGKTISDIRITESGIIAAAHLKGFGSAKSPGVRQFLATNGGVDPKDANGTPVSKYMRLFAGYDLGCCGSVTAVLTDKDKKPIAGLDYQIKIGSRIAVNGKTNAQGATRRVDGLDAGANITILVRKIEAGFKEIKSFALLEQTAFVATLRSATRMVETQLEKHRGTAGDYQRHGEVAAQKSVHVNPAAAQSKPKVLASTAPTATKPHAAPVRQGTPANGSTANTATSIDANVKPAAIASAAPTPRKNDMNIDAPLDIADGSVGARHAAQDRQSGDDTLSLAEVMHATTMDVPRADDGEEAAPAPQPARPLIVEPKRNEDGHPVAVAKPGSPLPMVSPSVQKLEEILVRNVSFGKPGQALSGPVAAEKSRRGEPISSHSKPRQDSLGQCYKYVKIALLASGMAKHYLGQEAAKNAGPELRKEGYRNLLDNPAHGMQSPYDAPLGAVIVYDVTDGSPWGHIEVRVSTGFASDYLSRRPRTTPFGKERESTMEGRNRKVVGIWIKD